MHNVQVILPIEYYNELKHKANRLDKLESSGDIELLVYHSQVRNYHSGYKKVRFTLKDVEESINE